MLNEVVVCIPHIAVKGAPPITFWNPQPPCLGWGFHLLVHVDAPVSQTVTRVIHEVSSHT